VYYLVKTFVLHKDDIFILFTHLHKHERKKEKKRKTNWKKRIMVTHSTALFFTNEDQI